MKLSEIILICLFVSVSAYANETVSIWQIGKKNADFSEFALAGVADRGQYNEYFSGGVEFTVGKDSESTAWPSVHPGQMDAWAGARNHTYVIKFNLGEQPYEMYAFNIHLTSSHRQAPPELDVRINDKQWNLRTSAGPGDQALRNPKAGGHQTHEIIFKKQVLKKGENQIKITTRGSWMIYDALELLGYSKLAPVTGIQASSRNLCYRGEEGDGRLINLKFTGGVVVQPVEMVFEYHGETYQRILDPGSGVLQTAEIYLPIGCDESGDVKITMQNSIKPVSAVLNLSPVRKWEVHLIHQTHLDIGYTHKQEEVLRNQIDHFYKALEYIEASKDYPQEARFKWHPEGMWAVEEFLRTESEENKRRFIEATKTRDIHIDAMYAQAMTGAYSEEELFELFAAAARYGKEYGVTVDSAMLTDIPGHPWGLVNALSHHGVKYLNVSPNHAHRIGHVFEWGDKPFYWVSPCGKNRILFWMSGNAYSWFHGRPVGHTLQSEQERVFSYLDELDRKGYPYDMVNVRYNIGADNGPPNPALPDSVKEWNEKYVWPKLIISRNSDMMKELERRYEDVIPVVKGDFTPYWEDGMASTSADTGISRRAAEQLVQAQTLWTLLDAGSYPHDEFELAWNNLIMYDEHTWGAWNSISDPDNDFVIQQAKYKQKYALDGAEMASDLLDRGIRGRQRTGSGVIDVYNTLNWARSEVVLLSPEQSKPGDRIEDENGRTVVSQRLSSGELAFFAENVPAFGAKRFFVKKGQAVSRGMALNVDRYSLDNGSVRVVINSQTGAIESLKHKKAGVEMADLSQGYGINDYLYIIGRDAQKNNMRIDSPATISVVDAGPLVGTLKIESMAPGANQLTRIIRLTQNSDIVQMANVVDKRKERRPEGVYFSFPFNIPNGTMKIDTPWSVFQPVKDQIVGANKNYFCVQRFVDISNEQYGVTWVSMDAPIVQWDPIKIASARDKNDYRTTLTPNQTIHSWVMNNHWETNYAADQQGQIPFSYAVWPHAGGYDAVKSQQVSRAVHQPLVAVEADGNRSVFQSKLDVKGKGIVVASVKPCLDGAGTMVRLFNTNTANAIVSVKWKEPNHILWLSNPLETKIQKIDGTVSMVPQEIVTLRITQ